MKSEKKIHDQIINLHDQIEFHVVSKCLDEESTFCGVNTNCNQSSASSNFERDVQVFDFPILE